MHTLVFDIETVGEDWETLDETTKYMLLRWVERSARSDEERDAGFRDVRDGLGFSPLTGMIVAIGLYDMERHQGVVYYQGGEEKEFEEGEFIYKSRSEENMLRDFWEGARQYQTFVTFNGRGFDVPFLNIRSAVHGVRPSHNLMEGRYLYQQKTIRHIDLQDQFTFYGAMHRKPSLHLFCRAFGIESPKSDGISGDDVTSLFQMGKCEDIARYNAGDVIATTELYRRWIDYLG